MKETIVPANDCDLIPLVTLKNYPKQSLCIIDFIYDHLLRRALLYVQNAGSARVYIKFAGEEYGTPIIPILPESIPFLDPGQSLTYEHGKLFFNGGNKDGLLEKYCNSICRLPLYAVCNGNSKLVFQELNFP